MRKKLNIKAILKKNPRVNRDLLAATAELAVKLRRLGQAGPVSQLASPFERKHATRIKGSQIEF